MDIKYLVQKTCSGEDILKTLNTAAEQDAYMTTINDVVSESTEEAVVYIKWYLNWLMTKGHLAAVKNDIKDLNVFNDDETFIDTIAPGYKLRSIKDSYVCVVYKLFNSPVQYVHLYIRQCNHMNLVSHLQRSKDIRMGELFGFSGAMYQLVEFSESVFQHILEYTHGIEFQVPGRRKH